MSDRSSSSAQLILRGALSVALFISPWEGAAQSVGEGEESAASIIETRSEERVAPAPLEAGEDNSGEDNSGEGNPGENNPGESNPGEDNSGEDNPGEPVGAPPRFLLSLSLGAESCLPDGNADCGGLYPGLGWSGRAAVRFLDHFGVSLGFSQGWLFGDDSVSVGRRQLDLSLLGWFPLPLEGSELLFSGGLGPGWLTGTAGDSDEPFFEWSSLWSNLRFALSFQRRWITGWRYQAGLALNLYERGSYCLNYSGAQRCAGKLDALQPDENVADNLQLFGGLVKTW